MRVISHCHSSYSFDSPLLLSDIVSEAVAFSIDAIILCDHDTYGLTTLEESIFSEAGIAVFRSIEFTTAQGIHVIGVHKDIRRLERGAYFWRLSDLVNRLKEIEAVIIFPHPSHATGLLGNKNLDDDTKACFLPLADFFEVENFRYGGTFSSDIKLISESVCDPKWLVGSDAHYKNEVGAFVNCFIAPVPDVSNMYSILIDSEVVHEFNKRRTWFYFLLRRVKKSRRGKKNAQRTH